MRQRAYNQRTYKEKHSDGGVVILTLLCVFLLCVFMAFWAVFDLLTSEQRAEPPLNSFAGQETTRLDTQTHGVGATPATPIKEIQTMPNLDLHSSNAILTKVGDMHVLFDKGSTERIYPASMSKIMTSIVALENLNGLEESIVLDREVFYYITWASVAGFLPGEQVRAIDLLYGLLLPSGAECAIGLAEHVAGSESAFVDLMNEKARELGMNDTHFTNTTGLHQDDHYSTVRDIAILLQYALTNDTFYEIFTSTRHSTPPTNLHEAGITYYSTLFSKIESASFDGGSILGGKTGYTDEAGQCLASLGEKDGEKFILVTCGAPGDNRTQELHIDDAFAVYAAIP